MNELPLIPGNGDVPEAPFQSTPIYRTPGRRAGMTVWASGEVKHDEGTPLAGVIPTAPAGPASGPVTFMRAGTDQKIHSRQAQASDLVDLGGAIGVTSVGSALHNGWIVENEAGGYSRAGEAAAKAAAGGDNKADQQSDQQPDPNGFLEPMMVEHEAAYTEAAGKVGEVTFAALETVFTDPDITEIPETLVGNVARSLGVDRDEALTYVGQVAAPMIAQAKARVASLVGGADAVMSWARSDPQGKKLFAEAARAQVDRRDLSGYQALTVGYLEHLSETNPEALIAGLKEGGTKAKLERGKVLVNLDGSWSEFSSMIRAGAAKLGK
jgi:hypothetical protein